MELRYTEQYYSKNDVISGIFFGGGGYDVLRIVEVYVQVRVATLRTDLCRVQ